MKQPRVFGVRHLLVLIHRHGRSLRRWRRDRSRCGFVEFGWLDMQRRDTGRDRLVGQISRQPLLNQPRLDARGRVAHRIRGIFPEQCVQEAHEDEFDAPILIGVILQSALDVVVKNKSVLGPLKTFQMVFETLQQRRICRSTSIHHSSLQNKKRPKWPVLRRLVVRPPVHNPERDGQQGAPTK